LQEAIMGLSEREQQLLDDMERRLYQSEADVMHAKPANGRLNMRSLVLGILVMLAGVGALIAGAGVQQFWIGIVGFAVMLGGALLAFSKRDAVPGGEAGAGREGASPEVKESFSDRMNRRWEERMDGER
jgi:hypothetical protein